MIQNSYAPTGQVEAQLRNEDNKIVAPFADNWQTLQSFGFAIHPLLPKEKKPILSQWQRIATNDSTQLEEWARNYPYSNIGIATELSGVIVIDCDSAKGKERPQEWEIEGVNDGADVLSYLAEVKGEPFPTNTFTVWTPNKGVHLYFRDEGKPIKQGASVNGMWLVDTRSIGGFIVAPSSVLENGIYEKGVIDEIAPLPNWLRTLISPRQHIVEQASGKYRSSYEIGSQSLERQFQKLQSALVGSRNQTLASVAFTCALIVQRNPKVDAKAVMASLHSIALAIGLDRAEVVATIKSCWGNAILKGGLPIVR